MNHVALDRDNIQIIKEMRKEVGAANQSDYEGCPLDSWEEGERGRKHR